MFSRSLARDLRSAKSQLLYCDSQRDFHAGQPTSTARGLMLNHTVDEASLHPVLQLILPPEQLPPARSPAPKRGTPQEMSTRLFAALLAVGMPWQTANGERFCAGLRNSDCTGPSLHNDVPMCRVYRRLLDWIQEDG